MRAARKENKRITNETEYRKLLVVLCADDKYIFNAWPLMLVLRSSVCLFFSSFFFNEIQLFQAAITARER